MPRLRFFSPALMACLLTACSGEEVKDTLGLSRSAPDEYRVVSRPPLSIPPEFQLRPPLPGESELPVLPADRLARSLMTGETPPVHNQLPTAADTTVAPVAASPLSSSAEENFLSNIGVREADSAIREKLYEDRAEQRKEEDEWYKNLNVFNKKKEELVDPAKEAERLRQENVPVKAPAPPSGNPSLPPLEMPEAGAAKQ